MTQFKTSPLREYYPYLYVDVLYLKVFNRARFVSLFVIISTGVNEDGYREILDITLEDAESELSYSDFFSGLKERYKKVALVISDGHRRIKSAASKNFVGSSWQLCSVHFKCSLIKIAAKK